MSFPDQVEDLLVNGCVQEMKEIYTRTADVEISRREPNHILGSTSKSKAKLSRGEPIALA